MIIRREQPEDVAAARAVQVEAFRRSPDTEPVEAPLLDALRRCDGWLPPCSLVAELDGRIVGHNVCTRGFVGDISGLGLGPIAVSPGVQRGGVGTALMYAMIGAAEALGEPFIALLGSPAYYSRFGFVTSTVHGIEAPDPAWGEHFQVLPLTAWRPVTGTFRYAAPFDDL